MNLQLSRNWKYPQLHEDAPPVPIGMRPRVGVDYGCGERDCRRCYEPIVPAKLGSIENPLR